MVSRWVFIAVISVGNVLEIFSSSADEESRARLCESNTFPMVTSVNHLSFAIARELEYEKGNWLFSPFGLSTALGMAYMGASGQTAEQFENVLEYGTLNVSGVQVHESMSDITAAITRRGRDSNIIASANALFRRCGLKLHENYTRDLEDYYNAPAAELDFGTEPNESIDYINEWVRNSTFEQISSLLSQPLPTDTQLLLMSAIYFKGTWQKQFPIDLTTESYFFVAGENRETTANMMSLSKETFPFLSDQELGYKFLELPYKGEAISMLFALPLQYNQVPDINMTSELLCRVRSNMNETKLDIVMIPRFKIEFKKNLKSNLISMGINDAFTPGLADFSAMVPDGGIHISDVIHKAVIEVNEQGSEAAAVSGFLFRPVSAWRVNEFVASHSFLFYIVDKATGLVLFTGRVMEP